MTNAKNGCGEVNHEKLTDVDEFGQAEGLALAALAKRLRGETETVPGSGTKLELTLINDDEISSRDAQRLTINSRHNLEFLKQRFTYRFCSDRSRRIVAFPRDAVEQYMRHYKDAERIPDDYKGRRITSFASEAYPIEVVFSVMRDIEIPIQLFVTPPQRQIIEFIDEDFVELLELGLAERAPATDFDSDDLADDWRPKSLEERLATVSAPNRNEHRRQAIISWDDDLVEIMHVPPQPEPATPPWLYRPADAEAVAWQPRYLQHLAPLPCDSVPLAEMASHLGVNALVALAAHHPELVARQAIGLDSHGEPAVAIDAVDVFHALVTEAEYAGKPIPDNWQTLEDVAKDANVKFDGEDGLASWVADGQYGAQHIATVSYRGADGRRALTFCSPQLSRVIVDWVVRERARLEQAIALANKHGQQQYAVLPSVELEIAETIEETEKEDVSDAVEELRAKLQPLEVFAAQHSLDVRWMYDLIHAEHDAYVVDYTSDANKQRAYFATTDGIESLLQNLAPAEYRTSRQICEAYGVPLYLFDVYANDTEPVGDFLSGERSANVGLMPHYGHEQINHILGNYYADVAEEPMRLIDVAARVGHGVPHIIDYLTRHGVVIGENRTVSRQAGLRYLREHDDIAVADEALQTPTIFLMRTREIRRCDLTHADITAMCYDLGIPVATLSNQSTKRVTQHVATDRLPELQSAIERYCTSLK